MMNATNEAKPPTGANQFDESGHDPSQRNLRIYLKMIERTDWPRFMEELRKARQNPNRDDSARRKP